MSAVLRLENVHVTYQRGARTTRAVQGVSLEVGAGETIAIVGESGCGKTSLARAILGLEPHEGEIWIQDRRVQGVHAKQASTVGVVWQDPFASLDPRWKVGDLIQEPVKLLGIQANVGEWMERCGLPREFANRYPHQLSGGQRQRVALARALIAQPPLVLCDEPTSALDLSVQAQILNLLKDLQELTHATFVLISHDLASVRFLSSRVAVMYLGRVVEVGPTKEVFTQPRHPYTKLLNDSALTVDSLMQLPEIPDVPESGLTERGCAFAPRCAFRWERCHGEIPVLRGRPSQAACFFPLHGQDGGSNN